MTPRCCAPTCRRRRSGSRTRSCSTSSRPRRRRWRIHGSRAKRPLVPIPLRVRAGPPTAACERVEVEQHRGVHCRGRSVADGGDVGMATCRSLQVIDADTGRLGKKIFPPGDSLLGPQVAAGGRLYLAAAAAMEGAAPSSLLVVDPDRNVAAMLVQNLPLINNAPFVGGLH